MKKAILAVLFLVSTLFPETIYITRNGSGNQSGSSLGNAARMSWLNASGNWGAGAGSVSAGDTVLFNGTIDTVLTIQGSGQAGQMIVLKFADNAQFSAPTWTDHIITGVNKNFIKIDGGTNGAIKADSNGTTNTSTPPGTMTYQNDFRGINLDGCSDIEICNLSIVGMYRRVIDCNDNHAYGSSIYMIGGSRVKVHHNTLADGYYVVRYGAVQAEDSVLIYNNHISRASTCIAFTGNSTGHVINSEIHDNFIDVSNEWDGSVDGSWYHNDGIHTWTGNTGYIRGLKIYNNKFFGEIGAHQTAYIYVSDNTDRCLIYNNVIKGQGHPTADGSIYLYGDCDSTYIYNNTIYGVDSMSSTGIEIDGTSNNLKVYNNVVDHIGRFLTVVPVGSSMDSCDYNISSCYGTNNRYNYHGEIYDPDRWITAWRNIGFDIHGTDSMPTYLNDSLQLDSASFGVNAGRTLPNFSTDIRGIARPQGSAWDMGAYEFGTPQICYDTVTIIGNYLTYTDSVFFGDSASPWFSVINDTTIKSRVPAHPVGVVNIRLVKEVGSGTLTSGYRFIEVVQSVFRKIGDWFGTRVFGIFKR